MSLLLIVLLLDESHLELVEDVLKETNFNIEDWPTLGRGLGVYIRGQEYGYPGSLKECLRKWLSPGTSSSFLWLRSGPPTLYELAAVLVSIGYIKAGEYIIKTCKLIIMFNDQCYQYTEVIVVSRLL